MSVQIIDSVASVNRKVNTAIANHMNKLIPKNRNRAKAQIKSQIRGWIEEQPEVASLMTQGGLGSLNAQFGLPPGIPTITIEAILRALIASIKVIFTKVNNKVQGGIEFRIQGDVILSLLGIPGGTIITDKGTPLNWLEWLLTRGHEVIVSGYMYTPAPGQGRSGGGTMTGGSIFRVEPISFAGTVNNNFITRAFSGRNKDLSRILRVLLKG